MGFCQRSRDRPGVGRGVAPWQEELLLAETPSAKKAFKPAELRLADVLEPVLFRNENSFGYKARL